MTGEQRGQARREASGAASDDPASALVGENIALQYPTTEEPVVDIDRLDIPDGAITAVVGPNGSGKSTLLRALAGQLAPDTGSVVLDGQAIDAIDQRELARKLGYLAQESEAGGDLTVETLVAHGRYPHRGVFDRLGDEDRAAIDRALRLAGVADLRDRSVGQLSGGQKQLVWIAMVLAQDTDTLLLDEPTTFLDLHHQLRVLETVRELNSEGVTVGVVLHDIAQAARFADYLVVLQDGELHDWGPPTEVVTEDLLADVFRVDATVRHDPTLEIVPTHAIE
jgi:iron complex transport system ATP-binding protein